MALASYGTPAVPRRLPRAGPRDGDGGFTTDGSTGPRSRRPRDRRRRRVDRGARRPRRVSVQAPARGGAPRPGPLAARAQPGDRRARPWPAGRAELRGERPDRRARARSTQVWVQPAAGDAGTALGAALHVAPRGGAGRADDRRRLGRGLTTTSSRPSCGARGAAVRAARRRRRRPSPRCSPPTASWPGSRAAASTGRARSATGRCWPTRAGREPGAAQRRQGPRAVPAGRADGPCWTAPPTIFDGPLPEPVHALRPPASGRRGGTGSPPSSTSTAPPGCRPSTPRRSRCSRELLGAFERAHRAAGPGQHALNTAGRPMVDDPRDALELSAPRRSTCCPRPVVVRRASASGR